VPEFEAAYAHGRESGNIEARLRSSEERLDAVNGHLADVANQLRIVGLALQGLADRFDAAAATTIATAAALEKDNVARREKEKEAWSPMQKLIAIVGGLSAMAAILLALEKFVK